MTTQSLQLITETISNNSGIIKFLIVAFPISFFINLYQLIENQKYKKWEYEKELRIKEAELEAEETKYKFICDRLKIPQELMPRGTESNLKVSKLNLEIEYLKKALGKK